MRIFRLTVVLLLAGAFAACETPPPRPTQAAGAVALPVWPQPPEAPRIRFLKSVGGPHDWGIERSFFSRVLDALAGRGAQHFVRPTGVAERDGVLYVADPGVQALWILDSSRREVARIVEIGKTPLASPVAVALRPDGSVYLADSGLGKVFLLDRKGRLLRIAAQKDLERPAAVAYDAGQDRLYVADSAKHRISVFGPDGALLRSWGGAGSGNAQFNHPTHLCLEASGTLLVTDALNFRLQAFDRDGRFLWKLGHQGDGSGDFAAPKGAASDSGGHVYVVDALFDAVQIFSRDGSLLLGFGERGTAPGQFWLPGGLFITPEDRIYVADSYNQRIQIFEALPEMKKEDKR